MMAQTGTRLWILAIFCVATVVGCSNKHPVGDVYGEVTLDGKPIVEGTVRFTPVDGSTPTAGGKIVDGKFTAVVPVTKHRVQFSAVQAPVNIAVSRHDTPEIVVKELVPEKYNAKSELTFEVKEGRNEHVFELTTK